MKSCEICFERPATKGTVCQSCLTKVQAALPLHITTAHRAGVAVEWPLTGAEFEAGCTHCGRAARILANGGITFPDGPHAP